jgi:hypothetical protein
MLNQYSKFLLLNAVFAQMLTLQKQVQIADSNIAKNQALLVPLDREDLAPFEMVQKSNYTNILAALNNQKIVTVAKINEITDKWATMGTIYAGLMVELSQPNREQDKIKFEESPLGIAAAAQFPA